MNRPDLYIQHRQGEKVQKNLRVRAEKNDLFVIGSSKEADLRIGGEKISGCHAALRYRAPYWYLCDLSESGELLVGKERVTERRLDEQTEVTIGEHRLTLFSKSRRDDLFKQGLPEGDRGIHQVIVRSRGHIVETAVLKADEPFVFRDGPEIRELRPPTSGEWVITEYGNRTIQQRLVASQRLADAAKLQVDRSLQQPLILATLMALFLLLTGIILSRHQPQTIAEAPLSQQQLDMIFSAKTVKKKKAEVAKMASAKAKQGGTSENIAQSNNAKTAIPEESQAPTVSQKTSAALTSLRKSGLSSLVGKIAKRANKQGVMVATTGVSADNKGAGRAFYSVGTSVAGGDGSASKVGNYKLGGVGTRGKAGGSGDYKAGTGLTGGKVGMGDVAVVDEETVIEGGLDRDVIAEVIKRNLGQIRYCYERQLSSNPDLYGKVQVKFTIGADGGVGDSKVDQSTMKNAMVEGCILRRLAGWKFPLPKGGTMVKVSYPFLFKALD